MKRNLLVSLLSSSAAVLLLHPNVSAQISGTSAFMQGQYVEVGISECGVYGTAETPPAGSYGAYHGIEINGLGFIVDHEKDGWGVATAPGQPVFCGDYFSPGSPEEGWAIQYGDSVYENHYIPCYGYDNMGVGGTGGDIPGGIVSYTDTLGVKQVIWEGTLSDGDLSLTIQQITTLPDTALFYTTEINITNTGTTDLTDLYYTNNIDPDQDQNSTGDFTTYNSILSSGDTAKVQAIGGVCGCYFALTTVDPDARASYGNFFLGPQTPQQAWNGDAAAGYYNTGTDYYCDCAVQMSFKRNITAGSTASYSYARTFSPEANIQAVNYIEESETPVDTTDTDTTTNTDGITSIADKFLSLYPNPASGGFNLQMNGSLTGDLYLQVANTNGEVMLSQQIEASEQQYISAENLSKGFYIVKLITADRTYIKTLIIE